MERQKPDEGVVIATAPEARTDERAAAQIEKKEQASSKPPAEKQKADAVRDLAKSTEQAAGAAGGREGQPPPEATQAVPAPAPAPARREMESPRPQAGVLAEGRFSAQMQRKADTPEASLERIAELRKQGKHEEADKALAEFRKQHPDYRMSEEMRAKVEKK
jgi:hypothetical protein